MARPPDQLAPRRPDAPAAGFRRLLEDTEAAREIPAAVRWVHGAGQPFFDWVIGDRAVALQTLERWMHRRSSELSIERAVLLGAGQPVGGFIAVSGAELRRCRQSDALAAALAAPAGQRAALIRRFTVGLHLFPDVPADALYLSRVGVLPHARRQGLGKALVQHYVELGWREGFRRFALDVWSGNVAALALYRSLGFRPSSENHAAEAGMTYVRMSLEETRGDHW